MSKFKLQQRRNKRVKSGTISKRRFCLNAKYHTRVSLKGQCHAIWQLYKNIEVSSHQLNSNTNGLGLLCKTI